MVGFMEAPFPFLCKFLWPFLDVLLLLSYCTLLLADTPGLLVLRLDSSSQATSRVVVMVGRFPQPMHARYPVSNFITLLVRHNGSRAQQFLRMIF